MSNFYFSNTKSVDYSNNNLSFKPENTSAEASLVGSFSSLSGDWLVRVGYRLHLPYGFKPLESNLLLQGLPKNSKPTNLIIQYDLATTTNIVFDQYIEPITNGSDSSSTVIVPVQKDWLPVWDTDDNDSDESTPTEKTHRYRTEMAISFKVTKQPIEVQDVVVDFSDYLNTYSDSIASFSVVADEGINISNTQQNGSRIYMLVHGGLENSMYKITVTITTEGNRVKQSEILVRVFER